MLHYLCKNLNCYTKLSIVQEAAYSLSRTRVSQGVTFVQRFGDHCSIPCSDTRPYQSAVTAMLPCRTGNGGPQQHHHHHHQEHRRPETPGRRRRRPLPSDPQRLIPNWLFVPCEEHVMGHASPECCCSTTLREQQPASSQPH